MTDSDRNLFLSLAWFPPDTEVVGVPTRSLSIASRHALRLMGLRCLERDSGVDEVTEYGELLAYAWLHTEDPETISRAVWDGSWRGTLEVAEEIDEEERIAHLADWRETRERVLSLLDSTDVRILPRKSRGPQSPEQTSPAAVVNPLVIDHRITVLMRETGMSRREVLWELPVWEGNRIYHAAMRFDGQWTAWELERSGEQESFEDFAVRFACEEACEEACDEDGDEDENKKEED